MRVGLSDEQIKAYSNNEFNDAQMNQIKNGFVEGLSINEVKVYAKEEYSSEQMLEIKRNLRDDMYGRTYKK